MSLERPGLETYILESKAKWRQVNLTARRSEGGGSGNQMRRRAGQQQTRVATMVRGWGARNKEHFTEI